MARFPAQTFFKMRLTKTKLQRRVWGMVQAAQESGKPLPAMTTAETATLRDLSARFPAWKAWKDEQDGEAFVRKRLKIARAWAYATLPGFHRHEALYHPDMITWAISAGAAASDPEWISAAKAAHAARPIPLVGYDREAVATEKP
jgi:hypothetical protein